MGLILLIATIIVFVVFFIASGYYSTKAAAIIGTGSDNDKLASGHKKLSWAAAITWIAVGLTVITIIGIIALLVVGAPEVGAVGAEVGAEEGLTEGAELAESEVESELESSEQELTKSKKSSKSGLLGLGDAGGISGFTVKVSLAITVAATFTVGVLAASGSVDIARSSDDSKPGYRESVIASVLGIVPVGLLITLILMSYVYSARKASEARKAETEVKEKKREKAQRKQSLLAAAFQQRR